MPTHMPHFPDLLFEPAARLRAWEHALMGLLAEAGYGELHPSLVMREPLEPEAVRFFDGADLVALRWDFTVALGRLLSSRFEAPPPRVSYAGAVFRRPQQPWEPVERFEVGCERLQAPGEDTAAADVELARLMVAMPAALGLRGGILQPKAPTTPSVEELPGPDIRAQVLRRDGVGLNPFVALWLDDQVTAVLCHRP